MKTNKEYPKRTDLQRKAKHLYFKLLADALNDAGYTIRKTLRNDFDLAWTPGAIKELIWRPVQEAMTGKVSTTEINTVEVSQIYEIINLNMAEKFGISIEWPEHKIPEPNEEVEL